MSEEREYKDGFNVGVVIERNGWNVLDEYHEHHDGLVGVITHRYMNLITIQYYTPLLNVNGYVITGDSIYPECIREIIKRKAVVEIRNSIISDK